MVSNSSHTTTTNDEETTLRYQKQMKAIIDQLHKDFAYGRIGGILAKDFPNHLQSHVNQNFKNSQTVEKFTTDLYNSVKLAKQLCDLCLAFPGNDNGDDDDDDEEIKSSKEGLILLPHGFWADVVRQLRRLIQIWLRMDEVLVHLAIAAREQQQQQQEQQSEFGNGNGNYGHNPVALTTTSFYSFSLSSSASSRDGLSIIQDDIYATSLLQYLKMLNLFVGGDYLVQLCIWCNTTNSLITIINKK